MIFVNSILFDRSNNLKTSTAFLVFVIPKFVVEQDHSSTLNNIFPVACPFLSVFVVVLLALLKISVFLVPDGVVFEVLSTSFSSDFHNGGENTFCFSRIFCSCLTLCSVANFVNINRKALNSGKKG